jgi:peptidoglycan/xylan/chitin deacetylase (PgdA/CDA1 family)
VLNPVPILCYHSVSPDPPDWIAPFAVTPATFAAHLDAIRASGRRPLTVSQYADGLRGLAELPARPVLVTVDDGFADFAEFALPALAERGMPSTLYVTTGALAGRPGRRTVLPAAPMLHAADLPWLEAAGVEIGAHSHTHRQLDLLPGREVAEELTRSRDLLAGWLGHDIRSFAYPHGYWRARVRRLVLQAGFASACAVGEAHSSPHDHPLALSRFLVRAGTGSAAVATWLGDARPAGQLPGHRVLAFGWRQCRRTRVRQRRAWPS